MLANTSHIVVTSAQILGKHHAAHSPTGLHEWNNFSPKLELPLSIQLSNWASIDQLSFFEELGPDGVWGGIGIGFLADCCITLITAFLSYCIWDNPSVKVA